MNGKVDEPAKGMARSATCGLLWLAVATQIGLAACAIDFRFGPLADLSDPDALAACGSSNQWIGGDFNGIGT